MAGKSQTQHQLDQLEKVVDELSERVDGLREDIAELAALRREINEGRTNYAILSRDLDEVRRNVDELKQQRKEAGHQWWMLAPPIGGAIASVLLSALIAYLLNRK